MPSKTHKVRVPIHASIVVVSASRVQVYVSLVMLLVGLLHAKFSCGSGLGLFVDDLFGDLHVSSETTETICVVKNRALFSTVPCSFKRETYHFLNSYLVLFSVPF